MSYELKKPITDIERTEFIYLYNRQRGLDIQDTEMFLFALEANEIMGEKEIEVDVEDFETVEIETEIHDIDEEGNYIYDEDGNPVTHTETRQEQQQTGTHKETMIVPYPVVNPNYEQEQAERREAEFNKAFFNTSLGYIRRKVTMQDGSKKDFLSDLVLSIKAGLEQGLDVKILVYDKPLFDKDVDDWTVYQHTVSATPQFVMECLMQTANDYLPINEG